MAEAPRSAVHEDYDLSFLADFHRLRSRSIIHLVHHLHFQEVVTRSKCADLPAPPLLAEIGPNETHATIYVKTDRARTDDPLVEVKPGNTTHGKAIAPVNIRHGE